jgi:hypothetical protein
MLHAVDGKEMGSTYFGLCMLGKIVLSDCDVMIEQD